MSGEKILLGQYTGKSKSGGNFRHIRIDASTETLQTIDYEHHEIHGGSTFRAQAFNDAIGAGNSVTIGFRTGVKESHMLWEFVHEGDMTMTVLENPTITLSTGTNVTCKNSNRNSTKTSELQGYGTAALLAGNITKDPTYSGGTSISLKRSYATKGTGTSGSRRQEVVLKTETPYIFKLTNNETSAGGGQIRLEWYEHTPKN